LIDVFGVSGHEAPARQAIVNLLPAWARSASRVDEKGNLIIAIGEKPERVFLSHMDELGFEVMEVEESGKLWVETRGGGTPDFFEWHPALFHGGKSPLPAILLGPEGEAGGASLRTELDIGATSAEEARAMGARLGATVTARKKWRPLLGTRVSARSLDDRAGCAALIQMLRSLKPEEIKSPTWFVFTVSEETGLHGAEFLATSNSVRPSAVYAIDTFVSSDSPLESQRFASARLGEGFVIRAMDTSGITPRAAVTKVVDLARREGLAVQYGVTSGANDGSKFVTRGAVNVALGWPLRYSHSPVETADLKDIEALAKIIRRLAIN
jgi:putative aminopeptidase FrvX